MNNKPKIGDIIFHCDELAIMLLPNGLLIRDKIYEVEQSFIEGIICAHKVLEDPVTQFELPNGCGKGFASIMHIINNGKNPANPTLTLWTWLHNNNDNLFIVHPYIERLILSIFDPQNNRTPEADWLLDEQIDFESARQ